MVLQCIYFIPLVSLPNTTYTLQLYGQNEVPVGTNITIHCVVITSRGSPVETGYLFLALPTGEVLIQSELNVVATLKHNGTYRCIALISDIPTVASNPVVVYGK